MYTNEQHENVNKTPEDFIFKTVYFTKIYL